MKIIFSRKGFDSTAGGFPSIIFPNREMYSIPIPSKFDRDSYSEIVYKYDNYPIQKILNDITNQKINSGKLRSCNYFDKKFNLHSDPKFFKDFFVLGQAGSALGHLNNSNIMKGDIFLFYGWFKEVDLVSEIWKYKNNSNDMHIIWAYLIIDEILDLNCEETKEMIKIKYPFLEKHPHYFYQEKNNKIFLAKKGNFKKFNYHQKLVLTRNNYNRSIWSLPYFFNHPEAFSYLQKRNFNIIDESNIEIVHKGYGQEFVLDLDLIGNESHKIEIMRYINNLIEL